MITPQSIILVVIFILFIFIQKGADFITAPSTFKVTEGKSIIKEPLLPPPEVVAYDYDNTLVNQYTGSTIKPMLKQMKKDHQSGKKVYVVTARLDRHTSEVRKLLDNNGMSDVKVIATNRTPKSSYLRAIGAGVFYDDQEPVLKEVKTNYPTIRAYQVLYETEPEANTFRDMIKEIR